jgi:hypothetical protein
MSEEINSSLFKVTVKVKSEIFSEKLVSTYKVVRCYNLEVLSELIINIVKFT